MGMGILRRRNPKKVLVQLGQVQAGRVMKFTSVKDIRAKAAIIKSYVREAIGVAKAGLRIERKKTSDLPVPAELTARFRKDPRFERAFQALTPGRQRSYLYHFAAAKQSPTRVARIEKAAAAIFKAGGSWTGASRGLSRGLAALAIRCRRGPVSDALAA